MLPFITKFDAANQSSGSIDPLGALQVYVSLVDQLLPGLSTITNRVRYISMVSAALRAAEDSRGFAQGPESANQRRKAAEAFERLWALACVCAEQTTPAAADGLRGVRGARKALAQFSGEHVAAGYRLLKDQSRTGGIPTYWVTLTDASLVNQSGSLNAEGRELAACFPEIPLSTRELKDLCTPGAADKVRLTRLDLANWAKRCNLVGYGDAERRLLADVMRVNPRRACVTRALAALQEAGNLPERWVIRDLKALKSCLAADKESSALDLPAVTGAIIAVERFHEAVLGVFDGALYWATKDENASPARLQQQEFFQLAADQSISFARDLLAFNAASLPKAVRVGFEDFRVFARSVAACKSHAEVLEQVMDRHRRVQGGKVSGGAPKREWISWASANRMLKPAAQFQRTEPPTKVQGKVLTHPYRFEQFVGMLREVRVLPQPA